MAASAQTEGGDAQTVVVTGSLRAQRVLDAPHAIGVVEAQTLRDAGPMVNLSEALQRVPGLTVSNRNNYAQDLQISSRGFGARAGFGVRGLRLYTDNIPATMPDGQGQVAHFDLAGASRIEVLRGPFSVLYGNSSGGVIALFTAPARSNEAEAALDVGSFGLRQGRVSLAMPMQAGFDLRASATSFEIDGFRPQSAAERKLGNLRFGWQGDADSVTVLISAHEQDAQDPLGLDRAAVQCRPVADHTAGHAVQHAQVHRADAGRRQLAAPLRQRTGPRSRRLSPPTSAHAASRSSWQSRRPRRVRPTTVAA